MRLAVVVLAATAFGLTAAANVSATPTARDQSVPVATASTITTTASTNVRLAAAYPQVATVKVTNALLRAQPNTWSTKLDVSQPPRGVYIYCWHDYTDSSHYVWYRATPFGSRYTGWMRADLLYRSGPLPPRC